VCARELQAHFSGEGKRLLGLAGEQAAMIFEIATVVREGIRNLEAGESGATCERIAHRAREFEHSADQLVAACREAVRQRPEYTKIFRLLETADELEEIAFLTELLATSEPKGEEPQAAGALSDLALEAAQEWIKALSVATRIDHPGAWGTQDDSRDFLTAIDALFALKHRADDAERALTHAAVCGARDFRELHLYSRIADSFGDASDALKRAGLTVRDYLFNDRLDT
jgi:hypothetical protein